MRKTAGRALLRGALPLLLAVRVGQAQAGTTKAPAAIVGVVHSRDGRPVPSADVLLTRAPDMAVVSSTTDSVGTFEFLRPGGTGE